MPARAPPPASTTGRRRIACQATDAARLAATIPRTPTVLPNVATAWSRPERPATRYPSATRERPHAKAIGTRSAPAPAMQRPARSGAMRRRGCAAPSTVNVRLDATPPGTATARKGREPHAQRRPSARPDRVSTACAARRVAPFARPVVARAEPVRTSLEDRETTVRPTPAAAGRDATATGTALLVRRRPARTARMMTATVPWTAQIPTARRAHPAEMLGYAPATGASRVDSAGSLVVAVTLRVAPAFAAIQLGAARRSRSQTASRAGTTPNASPATAERTRAPSRGSAEIAADAASNAAPPGNGARPARSAIRTIRACRRYRASSSTRSASSAAAPDSELAAPPAWVAATPATPAPSREKRKKKRRDDSRLFDHLAAPGDLTDGTIRGRAWRRR